MIDISLDDIREAQERLAGVVRATDTIYWPSPRPPGLPRVSSLSLKLELLQKTGTFKFRGAYLNIVDLDKSSRARGIVTISGGNHAIAAAAAAQAAGVSAKVVLPATANAYRREKCKTYGAEIVDVPDIFVGFEAVEKIRKAEGRVFVHPFEGRNVTLGTATLGAELIESLPFAPDFVFVPIGGGGLASGVSLAARLLCPEAVIIGVEPEGAPSMSLSFKAGSPQKLEALDTIADSLGAPYALPYSFHLCKQNIDEIELVSDDSIRKAMRFVYDELKFVVEPACAATTAAICSPHNCDRLAGKSVATLFCGTNIDLTTARDLMHPN